MIDWLHNVFTYEVTVSGGWAVLTLVVLFLCMFVVFWIAAYTIVDIIRDIRWNREHGDETDVRKAQ